MMTIIDLVRLYQLFAMKVAYQGVISPRIIELEISGSKMMMKVHVLQPHLHFILQFLDLKQNSSSYF